MYIGLPRLFIEYTPGHNVYVGLPREGAIVIEVAPERDWPTPWWKLDIVKERGEYLIWFARWHVLFTPMGWTAPKLGTIKEIQAA